MVIHARRIRLGVLICGVLVGVVCGALFLMSSKRLVPDEIVDKPGHYRSPGRGVPLNVSQTPTRAVRISNSFARSGIWLFPTYTERVVCEFEEERQWFLCYDKYDRLWVFVGELKGTSPRPNPQGGVRPPRPTVQMEGFFFLPTKTGRSLMGGSIAISDVGCWEGVPLSFFERIPGKDHPSWGRSAVIPVSAPAFTPEQERQIAASNRGKR